MRIVAIVSVSLIAHCLHSIAPTTAQAAEVLLSASVVGSTPKTIGYNVAHFAFGSNTESWWQYSGVNGARLWSTPNIVEPPGDDDSGPWGDGVTDESSFLARRASLRADPLNPSYINWNYFEDKFANSPTTGNIVNLDYAMERLRANDIEILATMHRGVNSYPFAATGTQTGYEDRWEHWQHFYAQAFHMGRHYDVQRYQMYNEPDLSENINMSQAEYLERLQLASDAINSALADVNQMFGKTLSAEVHSPVNSNGNKVKAVPGGEPRNDVTGWGELVIDNRYSDLFGNPDPNNEVWQKYTFHLYNKTGSEAGDKLVDVREDVIDVNGGQDTIPIVVGELNVHSAAVFAGMSETLDSPSKLQELGAIFTNYLNNQPDEMYVFKFGQTDNQGGETIKKNGTHYVDNNNAPHNVGGATKGAGVTRLVAKGFKGAKSLLGTPSPSGSGAGELDLSASHDAEAARYYLLANNGNASGSTTLDIDLNAWNIMPGTTVVVEEVSGNLHGEVAHLLTVPASGLLSLDQPSESTWLITIPDGAPRQQVVFGATDDAMVKAGSNANSNFGTSDNLIVKNHPTNAGARNVSFMKFDLGATDTSLIDQAILQVTGEDAISSNGVISHVYGIMDDTWDEDSITWNTAPNLESSSGTVNGIEDNFVEGIGSSASFLGHLTSSSSEDLLQLDITEFLVDHGDQLISLLVAREVRWDGEDVDDSLGSLQIASKERAGNSGPQLLLFLDSTTQPGDFDLDGDVDGFDFLVWQGDGLSHTELTDWETYYGFVPSSLTHSQIVPEPSAILLLALGMVAVPLYR
ncbi:CBM96 family carbohydrate-binding protein [Adhaeretor mobilis]|uniref:CBM96 family carbohydrate-binding protein n=1 Tax=Adhaeretor mobilis TaxID=1930276 RepID=UPI001C54EFF3|nr:DNRLRE domain-containing protein [Adhaeretor mobilis]